jgi:hypothetical protein
VPFELDVSADLLGRTSNDHDDLVQRGRRPRFGDDTAKQGGGAKGKELFWSTQAR